MLPLITDAQYWIDGWYFYGPRDRTIDREACNAGFLASRGQRPITDSRFDPVTPEQKRLKRLAKKVNKK